MSRPNPYTHGLKWTESEPPNPARNLERDKAIYASLRTNHDEMKRRKSPKGQLDQCRAEMLVVAKRMTKSREALTKDSYQRNKNL